MKLHLLPLLPLLLLTSCGSPAPSAPLEDSSPTETIETEKDIPEITWEPLRLPTTIGVEIQNVNDVLITQDGELLSTFYDDRNRSYVALSADEGATWEWKELPKGVTNPRAVRQLSDGSFLMGVTATRNAPILLTSEDGLEWVELETEGVQLPTAEAIAVWDLVELDDGRVLIGGDNRENDPDEAHATLFILEGNELSVLASFPGLGVMTLEKAPDGTLYAANSESDEHDDPELAGQAHVFKSTDDGETWEEVSMPLGANRIYDMLAASDGTLYLGTGIRGEFFRSTDEGASWETMTHVPSTDKPFGDPPVMTPTEATRVYQILELSNGMILVGTGNKTGGIFLTADGGESWTATSDTGKNIVTWGLAQDPATGTLWAGTGSYGGDLLQAKID